MRIPIIVVGAQMNKRTVSFLTVLICAASAFGGGTVFDEEVETILNQRPELSNLVHSQFDFCNASWFADLRIGNIYPLGGRRLGPYQRRVRPKGSKGNFDLILTVNTYSKGLDDSGNEVDVTKATKIDEQLISIDLKYDACKEDWCKAPQPSHAADGNSGRR